MPAPADLELLRTYLAGRDTPCPVCGYNLRDLPSERCTECGTELRLHVHPIVRVDWRYTAAMLGAVAGIISGLILAALGFGSIVRGPGAGVLVVLVSFTQLLVWEFRSRRLLARFAESRFFLVGSFWLPPVMACAWLVIQFFGF